MLCFYRNLSWPEVSLDEIKKRARLVVIDDSDFPYQALFKRDGYALEKWPDVIDLSKLETGYYDLILLDLQGVGRKQSTEQGLGVLRHLRQTTPSQTIIAYSNADWPLKYQDFFKQADAVLPKSSDYVDFKRKVDQLLQERFTLGFYLSRVQALLPPESKDSARIERFVKYAIGKGSTERLHRTLKSNIQDPQTISLILSVVQTAIAIGSLWKK